MNSLDPNDHMWLMLAEDGRKIRRSPTEHKPLDPGQAHPRIAITQNTEACRPASEASVPFPSLEDGASPSLHTFRLNPVTFPTRPGISSYDPTQGCYVPTTPPPHLVRYESAADGILIGRRPQDDWVKLLSLPLPQASLEAHLNPSASQPHLTAGLKLKGSAGSHLTLTDHVL